MKQYIVIDFDDVIVDTMPKFCEQVNMHQPAVRMGGVEHQWVPEDFLIWDAAETTGLSLDVIMQFFADIDYTTVEEVPDAVTTIRDLINDGHSIQIVTANPREESIRHWLDRNWLSDVPLTSTPDKMAFMKRRGFNVIVEDNPHTLVLAVDAGYTGIRFARPWNKRMVWGYQDGEQTASNWYRVGSLIRKKADEENTLDVGPNRWSPGSNYGHLPFDEAYTKVSGMLKKSLDGMQTRMTQELFDSDRREIEPLPPIAYAPLDTSEFDDVVTNAKGAKQTDLKARFDLLPAVAIAKVAQVLHTGAEKYGEENWRGLSVEECHNHTIGHAIGYNNSKDLEDLAHAACRALMTLELALTEWVQDGD